MSDAAAIPVRKFHLSLNVSNLPKSVGFYRVLFDRDPAKQHTDYAKFEVESPPAVFSLIPGRSGPGGALNHVGLCLTSSEELVAIQHRLEAAGHKTLREDGVECCYARQTKFWVRDPDGVLLELYVFHEDLDEHGEGHVPEDELPALMGGSQDEAQESIRWTHQLTEDLALPLQLDSNSVREVMLEGSLNAGPERVDLPALLQEALRVLKPGGVVTLHGLAADVPLRDASPSLPGPAAAVRHVPDFPGLMQVVREAGFCGARFEKLSEKGYFEHEGVPLREVLISATKPGFRSSKKDQTVVYTGPQAAVEDDFGNRFQRGIPTVINRHDWQALKGSPAGAHFALLQGGTHAISCGSGNTTAGT